MAARAARAGVSIIAVTSLPSHYAAGVVPVRSLRQVRLALGLHPLLAPHEPQELTAFRRFAATTSYIGEVGLDFSRHGRSTREAQVESFHFVLDTLRALKRSGHSRFLTIHTRGAERAVLDALEGASLGPAVLHWYSGPLDTAEDAVAHGHFFSVNRAMLRSRSGRRLLDRLPSSRVLLETDGPYVEIDGCPSEPADLRSTLIELSEIWGCSLSAAAADIHGNLCTLLEALGLGGGRNETGAMDCGDEA